jgi:hypothetical protein
MKITIEATEKTVQVRNEHGGWVPARIWEGETETGVPVHCYVTRIAVPEGRAPADYEQFERELRVQRKPSPQIDTLPLRMVL